MDAQAESSAPRASGHLSEQELDKLNSDIDSIDIDNSGLSHWLPPGCYGIAQGQDP